MIVAALCSASIVSAGLALKRHQTLCSTATSRYFWVRSAALGSSNPQRAPRAPLLRRQSPIRAAVLQHSTTITYTDIIFTSTPLRPVGLADHWRAVITEYPLFWPCSLIKPPVSSGTQCCQAAERARCHHLKLISRALLSGAYRTAPYQAIAAMLCLHWPGSVHGMRGLDEVKSGALAESFNPRSSWSELRHWLHPDTKPNAVISHRPRIAPHCLLTSDVCFQALPVALARCATT